MIILITIITMIIISQAAAGTPMDPGAPPPQEGTVELDAKLIEEVLQY